MYWDSFHAREPGTGTRHTLRRSKGMQSGRWQLDVGLQEVSWDDVSVWMFWRLHFVCGCRATVSGRVHVGHVYGYWTLECTVDQRGHEEAFRLGLSKN